MLVSSHWSSSVFNSFNFFLVCLYVCTITFEYKSEDNMQESIFSFYSVGPAQPSLWPLNGLLVCLMID